MATLVVPEVDDETVRRLEQRAKAAGRSAEAELRAILEDVLRPKRSGADLWREMRESGPLLADDDDFFKNLESMDQPAEPFEFTD
jgi:plasmid stability protein